MHPDVLWLCLLRLAGSSRGGDGDSGGGQEGAWDMWDSCPVTAMPEEVEASLALDVKEQGEPGG